MSWQLYQRSLELFGLLSVCPWAVGYFYARALLASLASVRDEQHRLTLESPWFFFDAAFKPRQRRVVLAVLGSIFAGTFLLPMIFYPGKWLYFLTTYAWLDLLTIFFAEVGLAGFTLAGIAWWAPRVNDPVALATLGTAHGLLPWIVFHRAALWNYSYGTQVVITAFEFLAVVGVIAFLLVWNFVRRKLDRAWFRLDA